VHRRFERVRARALKKIDEEDHHREAVAIPDKSEQARLKTSRFERRALRRGTGPA
jgi:hypothetical protein